MGGARAQILKYCTRHESHCGMRKVENDWWENREKGKTALVCAPVLRGEEKPDPQQPEKKVAAQERLGSSVLPSHLLHAPSTGPCQHERQTCPLLLGDTPGGTDSWLWMAFFEVSSVVLPRCVCSRECQV